MNKLRQVPCLLGIQQTINKPPSVTFFTTFHQHEKEFLDQFQKLFTHDGIFKLWGVRDCVGTDLLFLQRGKKLGL